jgi:hypothetical protein
MSIQPVLGPYQFAPLDEEICGCGARYCTPFINGDFIAFQIADSCCAEEAGCAELNEACVTEQALTSDLTFTQANYNISFDAAEFVADDWVLKGSYEFAADTKYMICFCLREHTSATTIVAKIGTVESTLIATGNGNFCFVVDPGVGAPTTLDWGIIVTGGDDSLTAVLECMTLCTYKEFTAELVDMDGATVTSISRQELNNGNQAFELALTIPAEIPTGCYNIKLTNSCDAAEVYSQCLTFKESIPCTKGFFNLQLKWRNPNDAYGYDYETDTTYYNMVRVFGRLKHPEFPDDTEIFTESNNTNSFSNARVQKSWLVSLNDLPEYVHSAIALARRNKDFQIDGVPFVVADGSYTPEWRPTYELAPAEFRAFDQSFAGVMNSC